MGEKETPCTLFIHVECGTLCSANPDHLDMIREDILVA